MTTIPDSFDLHWMQSAGGGGECLLRDIPAANALHVLEDHQQRARSGEYGPGVFVYLRPSGPTEAEQLAGCQAALTASATTNAALIVRVQMLRAMIKRMFAWMPADSARRFKMELAQIERVVDVDLVQPQRLDSASAAGDAMTEGGDTHGEIR